MDEKKIDEKLVKVAHTIGRGRISKEDAQEMLRVARENVARLQSCVTPHDFQPVEDAPGRFQCSLCQGLVSSQAFVWYKKGLEHGRSSTN